MTNTASDTRNAPITLARATARPVSLHVEVDLQREVEANFYRTQARDERIARKAGAK